MLPDSLAERAALSALSILRLVEPTSGEVRLGGTDVIGLSQSALRRARADMQMIFQDPQASLNPRMTVGDIVAEGWAVHADIAPRKDRLKRTQELLDRVGLNPDYVTELHLTRERVDVELLVIHSRHGGLVLAGDKFVTGNVSIPVEREAGTP